MITPQFQAPEDGCGDRDSIQGNNAADSKGEATGDLGRAGKGGPKRDRSSTLCAEGCGSYSTR